MNPIIKVFNSMNELEKYASELPKGFRDPELKKMFYELFIESKAHSWEEFNDYVDETFNIMQLFASKFKDLVKPTKEEFYHKIPYLPALEAMYDADNSDFYYQSGDIINFYNQEKYKEHRNKKVPESSFFKLLEYFEHIRTWDKVKYNKAGVGNKKYFIGDVEAVLIYKKYLKEPIVLRFGINALKQISRG